MRYKTFKDGAQIHTWFPKSVYVMKDFQSVDACLDYSTSLSDLGIELKREYFQVDTSHSVGKLHTQSRFTNLFDDCDIEIFLIDILE